MPILPKCCFCAKLETGGYIIGGIGVLIGSLFIIGSIAIGNSSNEIENKDQITFIFMLAGIIVMITPTFLLVGTYKRNPRYVAVWLGFNILSIIIYLLNNLSKGLLAVIITTAIQIYFWLCIFSLYQLFKAEESQLPINNSIPMNQTNTDLPPRYADVSLPMVKGVEDYASIP